MEEIRYLNFELGTIGKILSNPAYTIYAYIYYSKPLLFLPQEYILYNFNMKEVSTYWQQCYTLKKFIPI